MSVLKETGAALSRSCRKIFYLVSNDYDIVRRLIDSRPAVFEQRMRGIDDGYFRDSGSTYKRLLNSKYIEDLHYWLQASLFSKEENPKKREWNSKARILICGDFHLLKKNEQGRVLKQFLDYVETQAKECILLLSAPILDLPMGYEQIIEVIDMPEPDEDDIREQLLAYAIGQSGDRKEVLEESAKERIAKAAGDFKGLDFYEIEDILYRMTKKYGSFYGRSATQKRMPKHDNYEEIARERRNSIAKAKKEKAQKDSTVTILESGNQIAGLGKYQEWFQKRKDTIKNPNEARKYGREPIRGVLMTGLPGTGKTQGAKYTAYALGIPLVQLRIDNLLGGLVGDSEKNFKRYRKQVEALAPCVVLIDEIEKLFPDEKSGGHGSGEVKMNIFSALLDWMQESKKGIFFYATCNSVKSLPPELLRDGRFSMRFCVFMPTFQELAGIIQFHMKRVHELSDGKVFKDTGMVNRQGEISPKAAEKFLDRITSYGKKEGRNMFFTGANIEALINEVQYCSRNEITDIDQYVAAMCNVAAGEFCQPYGETNLKSSVDFWIDALENNFTDAADYGKRSPLSFRRFNRQTGRFDSKDLTFDNNYDEYLFEVFSKSIEQAYEKKDKTSISMLEQISQKLDRTNHG